MGEGIIKRKLMKMYLNEVVMLQIQQKEELDIFINMFLALDSKYKEGVVESSSISKESCCGQY